MSKLTDEQKQSFLNKHIPHRLTLLRAFQARQRWFKEEAEKCHCHGDLLRCSKDSALISIRLFTDALGLLVTLDRNKNAYMLSDSRTAKFQKHRTDSQKRHPDSVWIDDLGGQLVLTDNLTAAEIELLIAMNNRADKELAHLTSTFNEEFNSAKSFMEAIDLITRLLKEHLYDKHLMRLPAIDKRIIWHLGFFDDASDAKGNK